MAVIESDRRHRAVGDGGKALGAYQFWESTWNDVTILRKRQKLPVISWRKGAVDPEWSKQYAITYLKWLEWLLSSELGEVNDKLLYSSWNAGVNKVISVQGDFTKLPEVTQAKLLRF